MGFPNQGERAIAEWGAKMYNIAIQTAKKNNVFTSGFNTKVL